MSCLKVSALRRKRHTAKTGEDVLFKRQSPATTKISNDETTCRAWK